MTPYIIIGIVVFVLFSLYFIIRYALVRKIFLRINKSSLWDKGADYAGELISSELKVKGPYEKYTREVYEGRRWIFGMQPEKITIKSGDGLSLVGHYIDNPEKKLIVIAVHGYRSCGLNDFSVSVKEMYDRGCAVLLVDQRAHGESEGDIIAFGVKERYDIKLWCEYVADRFPGVPVMLTGVSMGAATVMMASALELPSCVRGIAADCGYTSPRAIYSAVASNLGRLTPLGVKLVEMITKPRIGFGFDDGDTREALKTNTLPIVLIHGKADTFVPYYMTEENYAAAVQSGADVRLLAVENADHALCFLTDRKAYLAELDLMIGKCICGYKNIVSKTEEMI